MSQVLTCPDCQWPLVRSGKRLRCIRGGCRYWRRLPIDQEMRDWGAPRLPGMEDVHVQRRDDSTVGNDG